MIMDVVELREFYASQLGEAAENSISMALSSMWGESKGEMGLVILFPGLTGFRQIVNRRFV